MSQPNTILIQNKESDTHAIWYSEAYIKQQVELAYRAGITTGAQINFHAITPMNGDMVNNLTDEFYHQVQKVYQEKYDAGHVWKVAKKSPLNNTKPITEHATQES